MSKFVMLLVVLSPVFLFANQKVLTSDEVKQRLESYAIKTGVPVLNIFNCAGVESGTSRFGSCMFVSSQSLMGSNSFLYWFREDAAHPAQDPHSYDENIKALGLIDPQGPMPK